MNHNSIRGWVYVITNKAMPGLLKIGYTLKDPIIRAAEFNGTGVPHPYDVEYEALVENPRDVEQQSHSRLQKYREGREWFRCDLSIAVGAIQLYSLNRLFLENIFSPSFDGQTQLQMAKEKIASLESKIAYLESDEYRFQDAINSDDLDWKKCIARYPHWPENLIIELYNCDTGYELSKELAGNPSMPPDYIHELVEECLEEVCEAAALNPRTRSDTLALIRWLTDDAQHENVAKHENYNQEVFNRLLEEYSCDPDYQVRSLVPEFSDCPQYLLERLASDVNMEVRSAVASNSKCPLQTLRQLELDDVQAIKDAVRSNYSHPHSIANNHERQFEFISMLENPSTPTWVLSDFFQHSNFQVRQAIALNPECPSDIREALYNDREIRVRIAAKHRIKK